MKLKYFLIFLLSISILSANAQEDKREIFIEFGVVTIDSQKSTFLENSKYKSELGSVSEYNRIEPNGTIAPLNLRTVLGISILNKWYGIARLGYFERKEQVSCYCDVCDKVLLLTTLTTIKSLDLGLGTRYHIFENEKIIFGAEAGGNMMLGLNEKEAHNFGFYAAGIFGVQCFEKIQLNLKLGYEQGFTNYKRNEKFGELMILFSI